MSFELIGVIDGGGGISGPASGFAAGAAVGDTVGRTGDSITGLAGGVGRSVPPVVGWTGTFIAPFRPVGCTVGSGGSFAGSGLDVAGGIGIVGWSIGFRFGGEVHPVTATAKTTAAASPRVPFAMSVRLSWARAARGKPGET